MELALRPQARARLRFANLRHQAAPEDGDYRSERGLDRALFLKLIDAHNIGHLRAVRRRQKLAGLRAWPQGLPRRSLGSPSARATPVANLALARGDGRYARFTRKLGSVQLLIPDDWGLEPLDDQARHDLLEILEDR